MRIVGKPTVIIPTQPVANANATSIHIRRLCVLEALGGSVPIRSSAVSETA